MGHRLSKITTRTGDDGSTGLADGSRVLKHHARMQAIGDVDELNSIIGMVLSHELPGAIWQSLTATQHDLFNLGGELAIPDHDTMSDDHVTRVEQDIERFNDTLAPLKEFILPGGHPTAALCHQARTVCRRAERALVALHQTEPLRELLLKYINRLSDLLFVLARAINKQKGHPDILWQPAQKESAE